VSLLYVVFKSAPLVSYNSISNLSKSLNLSFISYFLNLISKGSSVLTDPSEILNSNYHLVIKTSGMILQSLPFLNSFSN